MEDGRWKMEATTPKPTHFSQFSLIVDQLIGIPVHLIVTTKGRGFLRHGMEHGEDLFVFIVQIFVNWLVKIMAGEGEFEPGLGFGGFLAGVGKLIDEDGFVSPLAPGFGHIRAH